MKGESLAILVTLISSVVLVVCFVFAMSAKGPAEHKEREPVLFAGLALFGIGGSIALAIGLLS